MASLPTPDPHPACYPRLPFAATPLSPPSSRLLRFFCPSCCLLLPSLAFSYRCVPASVPFCPAFCPEPSPQGLPPRLTGHPHGPPPDPRPPICDSRRPPLFCSGVLPAPVCLCLYLPGYWPGYLGQGWCLSQSVRVIAADASRVVCCHRHRHHQSPRGRKASPAASCEACASGAGAAAGTRELIGEAAATALQIFRAYIWALSSPLRAGLMDVLSGLGLKQKSTSHTRNDAEPHVQSLLASRRLHTLFEA